MILVIAIIIIIFMILRIRRTIITTDCRYCYYVVDDHYFSLLPLSLVLSILLFLKANGQESAESIFAGIC